MIARTFIEFNTNTNQIKVSGASLSEELIIDLHKGMISNILYGEYRNVYYDKGSYWRNSSQTIISLSMIYELINEKIPSAILGQDVAFVVNGVNYNDWREIWLDEICKAYQTHIQFNSKHNILKVKDLLNKSSKAFYIDEYTANRLIDITNEDEAVDIILKAIDRKDRIDSSSNTKLICSIAFDSKELGRNNNGLRALGQALSDYYAHNYDAVYEPESNYEPVRFQLTEKGKALAENLNNKETHYDDDDDDEYYDEWYIEDDEDEKEKVPEVKINPNFPRDFKVEGYLKECQKQDDEKEEAEQD